MLALAAMIMAPNLGWGQTTIAAWTYPTSSGNAPNTLAAECGALQASSNFYADGTNGSDNWTDVLSRQYYAGRVPTPALCAVTTATGAYSLVNSPEAYNGKSVVFKISTTGYQGLALSYDTRGTNTGFTTHVWSYSTDGTNFTTQSTIDGRTNTTFSNQTVDFSSIIALNNQSNVYIKLTVSGATGTGNNRLDNINFTASVSAGTPNITVGTITDFGNQQINTTSPELTYNVSGSNLTANITITPPTGFLISTTSGSGYTSTPIILTQSEGTVTSTPIYVVFSPTLAQAYSGNITHESSGATTMNVAVSGTGTAPPDPEPTNHATAFAATVATPAYSAVDVTWADATGGTVPDGYVIKASTVSYAAIAEPVDGAEETEGTLVKIVAPGVQSASFTGLDANTTYYFKIWPYTNSGTAIDYKTDGTVPEATATTDTPIGYDNVETFDNFGATGTSYSSGTFLGQDGSTWNYIQSRGDVEITGNALMLGRNRTPQSEVYSGTIGGGIQVLNFDYMQAFGTNVNLNVLVNDVVVGNVTSTSEQNVVKNSGDITVNVSGNFVLKFINVDNSDGQVVIDNISWNSISAFSAYTGTGNWSEVGNWINGLPGATTDVIINGNVTVDVEAECNNMTISPTGAVTGGTAAQILYVYGDLLIESNATGTGSFIANSDNHTIGETTTIQRYLTGGWVDGWDAGWHQLSSPVAAQPIADFATTGVGNDYDFYGWDEPTNTWMNYKDGGFSGWNGGTNFNVGQGYLVSYEAANTTQTFTGVLNTADVIFTDLSNGGASFNGWHLLGNPFASALTWNDGNWALSNVAGNAKIWHEANKSYSDIASNGIIPSAQGFMVQVSSASNMIGIPGDSRVHDAQPFYKSGNAQLLLVAAETEGGSAQESKIMVNPMATEGFDFDYDSRFLAGYAPQLYSVVGDEMLSTNSLPDLGSGKVIPLGFVKNAATTFTIELKESIPGTVVYLTDIQTGTVTNLTETPVYSFTSDEGDDANRFSLAFGTVGISHPEATAGVQVFAHDGVLYVETPSKEAAQFSVYNLTGQLVLQGRTRGNALSTFNSSALNTGVYVVNILLTDGVVSRKVVINK